MMPLARDTLFVPGLGVLQSLTSSKALVLSGTGGTRDWFGTEI